MLYVGDHPVSNLEVQNAEKQLTILRNSLKVLQGKTLLYSAAEL